MALPNPKPLHTVRVYGSVPTVSSTSVTSVSAPFQGRVIQVGVTLGAASASADATCTTDINTTAITGGVITVTQSGSARGNSFTAIPTGANLVNENDGIGFVFSGSGTTGGTVTCWADIRRGTL